jgi:ABC-type antimicrobial peptide transport system permease subunit
MQRVAIARALVNNPDILLADEPTGALDSETSIQIMKILKKISKNKLVIMVTHNPDLAKDYSTRIITLKDGEITSDSNPYKEDNKEKDNSKTNKTSMSFLTALSLSFNNLMTKKGRTILVSLAGSIGIIGIALIMAVSTGFQNYIDKLEEDTLTSYPLTIMKESGDVLGTLLSMRGYHEKNGTNMVKEEQYITNMLSSVSKNDLKSFKNYLEKNYQDVKDDISSLKYSYSVDPLIYTIDAKNNLAKVNPSNLFSSMYGNNSMLSSYSSYTSIFSQMIDNMDTLNEQYDVLAGTWPSSFNEMIIVLNEPNSISDLLIYSLGLRDTKELNKMVTAIMGGEEVNIKNKPMTLSYDDLMNVKLKLILNPSIYKYNSKYNVYEDMSNDNEYMKNLYNKSLDLKIVGIVCPKEGVNSMALNPGVIYTKDLIKYIIGETSKTSIVEKQLKNEDVDVLSGVKFSSENSKSKLDLKDVMSIDTEKLQSAFNIKISQKDIEKMTGTYMNDISNSITTDINPAKEDFNNTFISLAKDVFNKNDGSEDFVDNYLNTNEVTNKLNELTNKYLIPGDIFKTTYSGLLKGIIGIYNSNIDQDTLINNYLNMAPILKVSEEMAKNMTEASMKKDVLTKVGELTSNLTKSIASSFNVDEKKIASAFKMNLDEDELKRIVSAMMNNSERNADTNLISLGYQDLDNPTSISFYFNSFDGKENFIKFLDNYNDKVIKDKKINYTDTMGILMSSVKTIINAVSYILIAFVSISLVVSSIMIGIITYISVYERTKEIGILRAIGASKRNISSIFNAETFIIGLLSGILGILITYSLIPIINLIIHHFTGNIPLNAMLYIKSAILLIILSIILTLIGGFIPSKQASKKDPAIALRTE